jgi:murein DD-endopeptidase MepM/ murein hydrolase activator NlpD
MAPAPDRRTGDGRRRRNALGFGPPRDAGITVGGVRGPRERGSDPWQTPLIVTVALFVIAGIVFSSVQQAPRVPHPEPVATATVEATRTPEPKPRETVEETPLFATVGSLQLRLPVPAAAVTAVAYHQSALDHAAPMLSLVPEMKLAEAQRLGAARKAARLAAAAAAAATGTAPATATAQAATSGPAPVADANGTWLGRVIRLWRSGRSGKPETAVDVGAPAGTAVVSPVGGKVVYIRTYKLYGKYDDFEIHISPTMEPQLDVVVIHVSDVVVSIGDTVEAGITRIASVRRLSGFTTMQIARYAGDGGDHTHLQVNRMPAPGMVWVSLSSGSRAVPYSEAARWESMVPTTTVEP